MDVLTLWKLVEGWRALGEADEEEACGCRASGSVVRGARVGGRGEGRLRCAEALAAVLQGRRSGEGGVERRVRGVTRE